MKTHVEFRSDAFPACDGEEDEIKAGRYGRRVAEMLVTGLRQKGFDALAPIGEDWGWVVPIQNDGIRLWIGCGKYDEYPDDGFLCFIEPHQPRIRRWLFWTVDTSAKVDPKRGLTLSGETVKPMEIESLPKGQPPFRIGSYYQFAVPKDLAARNDWRGLRTIGVAIRHSKTSSGEADDVHFYISSLKLNVRRFATCVRGHWGIKKTLHWCLDVTFREDENRVRNRTLSDKLAWLKRFAISLLKQVEDKESIAMRRRMAGWNPSYLAKVLGIPA
jgi:predicted transposase YbfD/YdcC